MVAFFVLGYATHRENLAYVDKSLGKYSKAIASEKKDWAHEPAVHTPTGETIFLTNHDIFPV